MKMYTLIAATTKLEIDEIHHYDDYANGYFLQNNQRFKSAMKLALEQKVKILFIWSKVAGNEISDSKDIMKKASDKFRLLFPALKRYNFNENHFEVAGRGEKDNTYQKEIEGGVADRKR